MARESLGTVRLHRWTCDVDGTVTEHRSKASGTIPTPPGWMHLHLYIEEESDGKQRARRVEADVCSARCAAAFNKRAIEGGSEPPGEAAPE